MTTMNGPAVYAAAFDAYRTAGWDSVLPLPAGQKKHPPTGYTGREALVPSYADCYEWAETRPDANIALRLPGNVIGIDVDHYDGKDGGGTLAGLVAQYGELPPTWTTGSRADGVSGIRLYRVPEGLRWPGDLGGGIEVIQARHRYAIVWPSIHPKTGGTYTWTHPDHGRQEQFTKGGAVPLVNELPDLPQAWVDGLTGGLAEQNIQSADLDLAEAAGWINTHGQGAECRLTERSAAGYIQELATGSRSRHEVIKDATMNLCHLAAEGHRGSRAALGRVRTAFLDAMHGDAREADAPAEWDRLILGALRIAAADTVEDADPCDNPLHGLMMQAPASPAHLLGPAATVPRQPPAPMESYQYPPAPAAPVQEAPAAPPVDDWAQDGLQGLLAATEPAPAAPVDPSLVPSWTPVDLSGYLDGSYQPEEATLMVRTDGAGLIYPGLVHDFHGESESGKSLVAQALCADIIRSGREVIYLDFESAAGPMAARMRSFGLSVEEIIDRFIYVRPELNPYALTETEAFKALLARRPALVILDGVTDALVQFGASSKENDEITKWHRYVPRTIANRTEAAVILIDHVVKSDESRGRFAIGGQAKMATIDGASYLVEIKEPIGKGMRGLVVLRVGKDRPGTIRPRCGAWRAGDRSQEAARVVIDSSGADQVIRYTFGPPESSVGDAPEEARPRRSIPTGAMERLSQLVQAAGGPMRRAEALDVMDAKYPLAMPKTHRQALSMLVNGGYIAEEERGRLTHVRPYLQPGDPALDTAGILMDVVETVDDSYGRATGQAPMI